LWLFGALALILFAALVSYDRGDPAFSSTGQPGPVTNLIGPFGAWLSDVFFVLFGGPAFLFPLMLGFAGYRLYQLRAMREPLDRRAAWIRSLGFFLALASSCGLATLHFAGNSYPNTAGGVVGWLLGEGLARSMSFLGATLLLFAVWLGSVSLATGISWLNVMDRIGAWTLRGISWVRERASQRRDQSIGKEVKQARQEVVREEQKKVAERKPPKIEAPAPKKSRCRCSTSLVRRRCPRCRCSMTHRPESAAIRPRRSRPCRASWN
jgi:S-DNA-T family DNA segregation ATPase FtsK/SpoIIIE